jgi:hypothetical protein
MRLHYDEDLVESVVFLCSTGRRAAIPPAQAARFHREREKPYSVPDPDERNAAFFRLHLDWFREWGLEKLLTTVLNEFPLLPRALNVLAFRKARNKSEEASELYVSTETGRNGVVALRSERFEHDELLTRFLRHELMHLQDMLDPAFGYSPNLHLKGQTAAQERLTRERYRLLWDITIDGRLATAGHQIIGTREGHRKLFDGAYSFWPSEKRDRVFEELWRGRSPHHGELVALASDPRELSLFHAPLPGRPCPLCGFPTFRWADPPRLGLALAEVIGKDFPQWSPAQGACQRCADVYARAIKPQTETH